MASVGVYQPEQRRPSPSFAHCVVFYSLFLFLLSFIASIRSCAFLCAYRPHKKYVNGNVESLIESKAFPWRPWRRPYRDVLPVFSSPLCLFLCLFQQRYRSMYADAKATSYYWLVRLLSLCILTSEPFKLCGRDSVKWQPGHWQLVMKFPAPKGLMANAPLYHHPSHSLPTCVDDQPLSWLREYNWLIVGFIVNKKTLALVLHCVDVCSHTVFCIYREERVDNLPASCLLSCS